MTVDDFSSLLLDSTPTDTIKNRFSSLLWEAKEKGSARIELLQYVLVTIYKLKDCANDFEKFKQEPGLAQEINDLIENLKKLLDTPDNTTINFDEYELLGLQPKWRRTSYGNISVNGFLKNIQCICSTPDDITKMIEEHEALLIGKYTTNALIEENTLLKQQVKDSLLKNRELEQLLSEMQERKTTESPENNPISITEPVPPIENGDESSSDVKDVKPTEVESKPSIVSMFTSKPLTVQRLNVSSTDSVNPLIRWLPEKENSNLANHFTINN